MAGLSYTMFETTDLATAEVYGKVLCEIGAQDPKVVGLSADLAKSTKIGMFAAKYPERFFNTGIAEQNMFGIAAGLARSGLTPFVSTFAAFVALRSCEQVRTDICYQNLNVKIIATHAGTSFGNGGTTHHCTEDLAIMRSFANMTVIVPSDGAETARAVIAAYEKPGPMYIRLNRGFDPKIDAGKATPFEIGKAIELHDGTDCTIIACGTIVYQALEAARILKNEGLSVRVINMHTIKPIDKDAIMKAVTDTRRIITAEDHNVMGGLGSAVAEVIVGGGKACAFEMAGIPDEYAVVGYPEDIQAHYRIDTNGLVERVRAMMGRDFEADENWDDEV